MSANVNTELYIFSMYILDSEFQEWLEFCIDSVEATNEMKIFVKQYLLLKVRNMQEELRQQGLFQTKYHCLVIIMRNSNYPI